MFPTAYVPLLRSLGSQSILNFKFIVPEEELEIRIENLENSQDF